MGREELGTGGGTEEGERGEREEREREGKEGTGKGMEGGE